MKDRNEFDELSRRKLAEREFPFDEAHWAGMERLLAERRRKRVGPAPWMLAAAGLLVTGGIWWSLQEPAVPTPAPQVAEPAAMDHQQATQAPSTPAVVAENAVEQTITPAATTNGTSADQRAKEKTHPQKRTAVNSSNVRIAEGPDQPNSPSTDHAGTDLDQGRTEPPIGPTLATSNAQVHPPSGSDVGTTTEPAGTDVVVPTASSAVLDPPPLNTGLDNETIPAVQGDNAGDLSQPSVPADNTPGNTAVIADPPSDAPDVPPSLEPPAPTPDLSSDAAAGTVVTPEPPSPPVPPSVWLAVRTPFEISALGGAFSTSTNYSGGSTEDWSTSTQRENTTGFGLEGMLPIGSSFGAAIGVHYSTYSERLISEELQRTDVEINTTWTLTPVDTMLTVIDSIIYGGPAPQYVTHLDTFTINVLTPHENTTYSTLITRQRREVVNRVSYVEIPVLFDAHTTCGRWVFGVRAGPTVGLLTSREGSVPGDTESGYADLGAQQFQSVTMGGMARAYASYRLSAAWSVGLEPAYRRQLSNAFGDGDEQRWSDAYGGYVSLSYRLGAKVSVP